MGRRSDIRARVGPGSFRVLREPFRGGGVLFAVAKLLWLVLTILAPSAHAADGLMSWRAWFWSEPGGPLDGPAYSAPAPVLGDWREFEPQADLSRAFGDASFSDLARGADGLARVAYRHGGEVFLAQRTGVGASAGWRHERVGGTELEWGDLALAVDSRGRTHVGYEAVEGSGGKRWVHAVREPIGLWSQVLLPIAAGAGRPWFGASPEGGLALYFHAPLAPLVGPAAPAPKPWSRAWLLLAAPVAALGRIALLARRMRSRRRLRAEAALIGRGLLMDVVVRHRGGSPLRPTAAGILLLHARTPVLLMDGLRPSEAWLGAEWAVAEGRLGWVEARCGPVALELAPEAGVWPSFSGARARTLLDAIRADRAVQTTRLVS